MVFWIGMVKRSDQVQWSLLKSESDMNQPRLSIRPSPLALRHSGMTLVELLIVIVIIGVLVSSVLVASSALISRSRTRNTQALLQTVSDALEAFKRAETEKPSITRHTRYKARYGLYPPDELEVFTDTGVPGPSAMPATGSLSIPKGALIRPAPQGQGFGEMKFYMDDNCSDFNCQSTEHRDLAAMIVAIESQGGEAAAILERIPDRNRTAGVLDNDGKPAQFLDRPAGINAAAPPNGTWDADDLQIRYIVDDWGIPLSYLAQRDHPGHGKSYTPSSNFTTGGDWNLASTEIIRANDGKPVIFSYGPDGKEQLTKEIMGTGAASLVGDFIPSTSSAENQEDIIDHPANADNVYVNEALKQKLAKEAH